MFELFFGIVWVLFMTVYTIMGFYFNRMDAAADALMYIGKEVPQKDFLDILPEILVLAIFWGTGLFFLVVGINKVVRSYKTKKYGEDCYGKIINISETGYFIGSSHHHGPKTPELKADIYIYLESTGTIEKVTSILGYITKGKYKVGDYVEAKHYKGNLNITSIISTELIPDYISYKLENMN